MKAFIVADAHGRVISSNTAAIPCGADIFARFPTLRERIRKARFDGDVLFTTDGYSFNISQLKNGVIAAYSTNGSASAGDSFAAFAGEFAGDVLEFDGIEAERFVTELYETAIATPFAGSVRGKEEHLLLPLISRLTDEILPRLRTVTSGVELRIDDSVTLESCIFCDENVFYFMMAALCSAIGYASRGPITLEVEHRIDEAYFRVAGRLRRGVSGDGLAIFGAHATDAVFAQLAADALSHPLLITSADANIGFELRIRANSYYPSWLKQDDDLEDFDYGMQSDRPESAEEEHDEHYEQLVVDAARE